MTVTTARDGAGVEGLPGHTELTHGEASQWRVPTLLLLAALILLGVLTLLAFAGYPHEDTVWMYIGVPKSTTTAA